MAIPTVNSYALPTAAELPTNKVNWAFEPARAALLIHDMQEYFLNFWGENCPMMEQVVANIAQLRDYCKKHNIPVSLRCQEINQHKNNQKAKNKNQTRKKHYDILTSIFTYVTELSHCTTC